MNIPGQGPQKILYITAEIDDFWSSRFPLALAAQKKGCEIHVATPHADGDMKLKTHGFHGHSLSESYKGFTRSGVFKNLSSIKKLIKNIQPDIIHVITLKYSFLTGLAARNVHDANIVFTIAGLGYLFSEDNRKAKIMLVGLAPFIKIALRHPQAQITFQNPDDQDILIRRGFVRPGACTLIRGSGVDLKKYSPQQKVELSPPLIIMPTRLVHDKGISVFIEMARILKKRQIPAVFQIAGGVTEHNPLAITKEEMERMVADNPVEWLGKVSDMPTLYEQATLVVYPSWYREGIPRVLLEAAAMGKAIITTDHPGCREAVTDNDNGLLVPIKNAEATANAVEALLKDPKRRKAMAHRSRQRAENEFDVNLITQQTLKIYGF